MPSRHGRLLIFVIAKGVIFYVLDGIWQVLLFHPVVGVIMGVFVILSLYQRILTVVVLVLQLARDRPGTARLHIRNGPR